MVYKRGRKKCLKFPEEPKTSPPIQKLLLYLFICLFIFHTHTHTHTHTHIYIYIYIYILYLESAGFSWLPFSVCFLSVVFFFHFILFSLFFPCSQDISVLFLLFPLFSYFFSKTLHLCSYYFFLLFFHPLYLINIIFVFILFFCSFLYRMTRADNWNQEPKRYPSISK